MRLSALSLILTLAASTAPAQTPAAALAEMLGRMPDPAGLRGATIIFSDLATARALDFAAVPGAATDSGRQQLRALSEAPFAMYLTDPETAWRASVGFGPDQVQRLATLSAPPVDAVVLQLTPGAAAPVAPALQAAGYRWHDLPEPGAWARGDDNAVDLAARNTDDPFGGHLGRASRIRIEGDLLRQATAWLLLSLLAQARPETSVAAQPDVAALLAALDGIEGTGSLLQAILWPEAGALGLPDPLEIVTGRGLPQAGPVPEWRAALLADLSDGSHSTAVLALTLALPETGAKSAQALREQVARLWSERPIRPGDGSFADLIGEARIDISPAGGGIWVLTVAHTGPTGLRFDGLTDNAAFRHLYTGALMHELVFVQP